MEYFIQQLINGLTLGSIYGLVAIGYTMVYGIIGMINFAHGDIFMLGGFAALIVFLILTSFFAGIPVALALLIMLVIAMLMTGLWNWTIERVAYRPLRGSFRLAPLITAIRPDFTASIWLTAGSVVRKSILLSASSRPQRLRSTCAATMTVGLVAMMPSQPRAGHSASVLSAFDPPRRSAI